MVIVLLVGVPVVFMVGLSIIATIAAIAIPNYKRAAESELRAECANNLKQIGMGLRRYAEDHDGEYPRLQTEIGFISFDLYDLYPKYVNGLSPFVCPAVMKTTDIAREAPSGEIRLDSRSEELFRNDSYYLYPELAVESMEEWRVYVEMYKGIAKLERVGGPEPAVVLPYLHEVSADNAGRVPVMIERPENHMSGGGHVLYLDGRVEFLKMGDKYLMVPEFFELLEEID